MPLLRRPELYAALLFVLLALPQLHAQTSTTGALQAAFPSGPGRSLVLESRETGGIRSLPIPNSGDILVPLLPPGPYAVTITLFGRPSLPVAEVLITQGETFLLGSVRSPAAEGSAPDLPLPDQDADGLPSLHALPSTQNLTLLDGVSTTQFYTAVPVGAGTDAAPDPDSDADSAELTTGPSHGLARGRHAGAAYLFSGSATREFHLTSAVYSAQSAQPGGALVSTVSQSGARALHGSATLALQSQLFAAAQPDAIATRYTAGVITTQRVKPHDLREDYAFTLAGPLALPRRQLFALYTYDRQLRGFPAVSSPADPGFYALTPGQLALLGNRGVTRSATAAALSYLDSLTGTTSRRTDQAVHFARVDYLRHPRLAPTLEFNRVRYSAPAGLLDAPVVARARGSIGTASGSVDLLLLRLDSTFTPRTLNTLHVAWLRDLQFELPQPPLPQEPAISPGGLAPEVNIGPQGLLFGTPASVSQGAQPDERRFDLAETLTLVRGRHTLALGGTAALTHDRTAALTNAAGTFHYDSTTAGGLPDFITDYTFNVNTTPNGACPAITAAVHLFCFQSYSQAFGPQRAAFSTQAYAAFAEDTFRPRPNLTVTAGLRYDYTLLPIPPTPNPALDAIFAARGATSIFPEDRNNFAPRASVAWQPRVLTVRLAYGVFYGRLPGVTLRDAITNTALPATTSRLRITPRDQTPCTPASTQGFGYPCAFATLPARIATPLTTATLFDRHFRLPAIQQANLMLERALPHATTLTAGYLLNLDRQLPSSTDLNIAPSAGNVVVQLAGGTGAAGVRSGERFAIPLYTSRVTPLFGPVTALQSHANGTYNALLVTVSSRPVASLTVRAAYTWSKAIDWNPSLSATPRTNSQLDPYSNGFDKALSTLNQPWAVRASAGWQPRPAHLRRVLDGFTLTPVLFAHAGRPYSFEIIGGTRLPGGHLSLNGSGGALYLPTVGRNTLRLSATATADLRLARDFALPDRVHLQLVVDVRNLTNHRNVSSINQRAYLPGTAVGGVTPLVFQDAATIAAEGLNTPAFGTPTAASTSLAQARQVLFQGRVSF